MCRSTPPSKVGPVVTTRTGRLHVTGQDSSPRATQYEQGLEDQDGSDYLIERGATAVLWSALMHVMTGCGLAQHQSNALRKPSCGRADGGCIQVVHDSNKADC